MVYNNHVIKGMALTRRYIMMYRIEEGKVEFYEGRDEMQAVEPTCGMGHHPVEFGFKEVSEIFDYQDAELIKAAKEKDGGVYQGPRLASRRRNYYGLGRSGLRLSSVKSVARSLLLRMMRKAGQCLGAMFVMDEPGYPGFSLAMRLA
jgi:hypothetical protein